MPNILLTECFIDGAFVQKKATFAVLDPSNGQKIADVANCDVTDTKRAIDAADTAFPSWSSRSIEARQQILKTWRDLIADHAQELAGILTREQGKLLKQAGHEIQFAQDCIDWVCKVAATTSWEKPTGSTLVRREPIGVVACFTPWNFPSAAVMIKVASALAAGCTVVVKPSEETPLIALAYAKLAQMADLPPGVLNVITTDNPGPVGETLLQDPRVRLISFTGSTVVGRQLLAKAAPYVKKVLLELGGNAPFIVFDDADLTLATQGICGSKLYNAGQICLGSNRIFAHGKIFDELVSRTTEAFRSQKLGPGHLANSEVGPLINEKAVHKIESLIRDAVAQGARILCGGKRHEAGDLFFEPTVIVDATPTMAIYREEIFGPVAVFYRFDDEASVLAAANDTEYGLAAYVYSRDDRKITRSTRVLQFGMIGANTTDIANIQTPFGGWKASGIGREGGDDCLHEFLEIKTISRANAEETQHVSI